MISVQNKRDDPYFYQNTFQPFLGSKIDNYVDYSKIKGTPTPGFYNETDAPLAYQTNYRPIEFVNMSLPVYAKKLKNVANVVMSTEDDSDAVDLSIVDVDRSTLPNLDLAQARELPVNIASEYSKTLDRSVLGKVQYVELRILPNPQNIRLVDHIKGKSVDRQSISPTEGEILKNSRGNKFILADLDREIIPRVLLQDLDLSLMHPTDVLSLAELVFTQLKRPPPGLYESFKVPRYPGMKIDGIKSPSAQRASFDINKQYIDRLYNIAVLAPGKSQQVPAQNAPPKKTTGITINSPVDKNGRIIATDYDRYSSAQLIKLPLFKVRGYDSTLGLYQIIKLDQNNNPTNTLKNVDRLGLDKLSRYNKILF